MTGYFAPSIARAKALRKAMDGDLWRSAAILLDEPEAGDRAIVPAGIAEPLDYGAYCDLALEHPGNRGPSPGERIEAARHLRQRLSAAPAPGTGEQSGPPRITPLAASHYSPAEIARWMRWWDIEPDNRLGLTAVSASDLASASHSLHVALACLRQSAPELHGEILATVRDFVIVGADETATLRSNAGSSFALWGSVMVNAGQLRGWPGYFKAIAHEAAHNLLFAIARDCPLVLNAPDEAFASPLRNDPRPMDGIFHAAFVSAREALAFDSLLQWAEAGGEAAADELAGITCQLEYSVIGFWQCAEILRKNARLSVLGAAILGECEAFIAGHFAVVTD